MFRRKNMEYISAKEAAEKWGLTKRRVLDLCNAERVDGAKLIGSMWIIPENAKKPDDARTKKVKNVQKRTLDHAVTAKAHSPQYKMHKYFARRPYNVFQNIITTYTDPGDIVLDCFCGGGVTIFESAALNRIPIGVDINPLATFITRMQLFNGDVDELEDMLDKFITDLESIYKDWYYVEFDDDSGYMIWAEWSYEVICPECNTPFLLTDDNKISNGVYRCTNENCNGHLSGIKRVSCIPHGEKILRVLYKSDVTGEELVRSVNESNFPRVNEEELNHILESLPERPDFPIPNDWDRYYEDRLVEKGVANYKDFYTKRNYVLNCIIFNKILEMRGNKRSKVNEYLYFLFSSSLRYTNKMTRVTENWENGKPTSMDKHAFWLPNVFVENNIFVSLKNRKNAIVKGCTYSRSVLDPALTEVYSFDDLHIKPSYMVLNQSSSSLDLPSQSVDAVITDPPYGSNVQYAELSTIWNVWFQRYQGLDSFIYKDEEAVVNRKSCFPEHKTISTYQSLLESVFKECHRVLKSNGCLVFTFNNKNIKVWLAMLAAVNEAGFYLPNDGVIFQDYIGSYKNTSHLRYKGNITGDFIYTFLKKPEEKCVFTKKPTAPGSEIISIIEDSLNGVIDKIFISSEVTMSTPELYQLILSKISQDLMKYLASFDSRKLDLDQFSKLSNNYIDNLLKKRLQYENGNWGIRR